MIGTIVWCDRCGAYADTFAVGLARVCPGRPTCAGKEQHLRRLRRGMHPASGAALLGTPIPEPSIGAHARPTAPPPARARWGTGSGDWMQSCVGDGERAALSDELRGAYDKRGADAAARVRALRSRVASRAAAAPAANAPRRRISGKTTPSTSSTAAGRRPRPLEDEEDAGRHASFRARPDGAHGDVRAPATRPRVQETTAETDTTILGYAAAREPPSIAEGGPVNEASTCPRASRAQLLARLASAAPYRAAAREAIPVDGPVSRIRAASDCLRDHGEEQASDGASSGRRVRPRRQHDRGVADDDDDDVADVSRCTHARGVERHGSPSPTAPPPSRRGRKRPLCEVSADIVHEGGRALGLTPAPRASRRRPDSSASAGIPVTNDPMLGQRGGDEPAAVRAIPSDRQCCQPHRALPTPLTRRQLINALSGNG